MTRYEETCRQLRAEPRRWLVTGVAGFIGSNLLETLLKLDQSVVGLDNFSTGYQHNLDQVRSLVSAGQWARFSFIEGDICEIETCRRACAGVEIILHQAALGSVPRSLANPAASHANNLSGLLNMLIAANEAGVGRVVYASSSSVYGDHPSLPKVEDATGHCLSPYAATKKAGEIYADVFSRCYQLPCVGLRYFNVFGPRQDPDGPYAAVIPKWVSALMKGETVSIHGDGETTRDFCYVSNAVQANILAGTTDHPEAVNEVYNVAVHARTSLNELYRMLQMRMESVNPAAAGREPNYLDFRPGDVRHSEADISKAARLLGYQPTHTIEQGLDEAFEWYRRNEE